jgi:predicted phage tail protein
MVRKTPPSHHSAIVTLFSIVLLLAAALTAQAGSFRLAAARPAAGTVVIEGLAPGTYYFAIQSVNAVGVASDYSGEVSTTI